MVGITVTYTHTHRVIVCLHYVIQ